MVIRIVLADDHPLTRVGIRDYLLKEEEFELVGEASDGIEAGRLIENKKPDIALLDIRMPGESGVSLARKVRELSPSTAVIMLTSYDAQQYVLSSLKAGAKGFVLKTATPEDLARAIRIVASGGLYLDSEVSQAMEGPGFSPENLSSREREVLLEAARGLSSKEIAGSFISVRGPCKLTSDPFTTSSGPRTRRKPCFWHLNTGWFRWRSCLNEATSSDPFDGGDPPSVVRCFGDSRRRGD
jgi:DNA-binding NarL/FixJ family response regulator